MHPRVSQLSWKRSSRRRKVMQSQSRKQVPRGLKASLLGVGACLIVAVHPVFPEEGQAVLSGQPQTGAATSGPQPLAEKPATVPEGASGMIIHIDPQTG